jgi:hypothetical protein
MLNKALERVLLGGGRPLPLSLAPALWLDLSDISTMRQDSAGTTAVSADADPVGKLLDKSGNNNGCSQATSGNRPLLKVAIKNGYSVLRFDGTDDMLQSTASLALASFTLSCVFRVNDPSVGDAVVCDCGNGTNDAFYFANNQAGSTRLSLNDYDGTVHGLYDNAGTAGFVVEDAFACFTGIGASSDWRIRKNGGSQITSSDARGTLTTAVYALGGLVGGTRPCSMDLAELIVVPRVLSGAEITALETYLAAKWGL